MDDLYRVVSYSPPQAPTHNPLLACTGEEPAQTPLPAKATASEAPKPLRLPLGVKVHPN